MIRKACNLCWGISLVGIIFAVIFGCGCLMFCGVLRSSSPSSIFLLLVISFSYLAATTTAPCSGERIKHNQRHRHPDITTIPSFYSIMLPLFSKFSNLKAQNMLEPQKTACEMEENNRL